MREVGVRVLREQLSRVLAEVEAGEAVLVTNHGEPIARIEPIRAAAPPDVRHLLATGRAMWDGRPLEPFEPVTLRPGPNVADILLAQRDDPHAPDDAVTDNAVPRE